MSAVPLALPVYQTLLLECPFAWKHESYFFIEQVEIFPSGVNLTISFTAKRKSKIFGYIPIVGTFIGLYRIYHGVQEYRLFNNARLHDLSNRSLKWIVRGTLETVPVLGGIICMVIDAVATLLSRKNFHLMKLAELKINSLVASLRECIL